MRLAKIAIAAVVCLGCTAGFAPVLAAQSTPQTPAGQPAGKPTGQGDNPFPGDAPQTPAAQPPPQKPAQGGTAKPAGDNPFPGEDANAPVIPMDQGAGADSAADSRRDADPDGDPVRTPDGYAHQSSDDGYSSSRSGLNQASESDLTDVKPGKPAKSKDAIVKEDVDVGSFYLSRKNWKAAQARFSSAFALDAENPDAVWGLAESERHMQLYQDAADHYKLYLSYDPDSRRAHEAHKALDEVQAALASAPRSSNSGASQPH